MLLRCGTTTPGGGGAGTGPVSPGSNPDAGTSVDRPDASLPPACDDSLRPCCSSVSSCPDELVCHVDNTCIAAASPDENGVATIEPLFPSTDELVAIDAQHAYGLRHQGDRVNGRSQLVRWPLAGGGAEVLADGASFYPGTFPIRVDAERLYFVAKDSEEAISFSLYSLPKDGSAAPAPHGTAGLRLVDDAEHVYFSNDGDSRVARLAKATLGTAAPREPVYTSVTDAPGTILSLAINSTHVMVVEQQRELSPMSYTVRRVDKISLVANILGDETKFTIALRDGDGALPTTLPTLANDTHLALLGADGYVDLLDLVTFEVKPLPRDRQMTLGSISGDDFYYGWFGNGPGGLDRGVDRLALRTGLRTELLAPVGVTFRSFTSGGYGSMVASPDGLWIVTGGDDGEPPRLLRIARSP